MKYFVICLCVVLLIFGLVTVNSFYVRKITDELCKRVDLLRSYEFDTYKMLADLWDKSKLFIGLTSSTKETDKIEDMLSSIASAYKTNDFYSLEEKKSLLINYIRLIGNHEKLNIENII